MASVAATLFVTLALTDAIPGLCERVLGTVLGAGTVRRDEDVGPPWTCLGYAALDCRQREAGDQRDDAAPDLPRDGGLEVVTEVLVVE